MTRTEVDPASRRREPTQARSRDTVDRLCDATALLLEESGWDALTTTAVAERAGTSVRAVYSYFPDKYSLVHETYRRFEQRRAAVVSPHLQRMGIDGNWCDAFAGAMRASVAFRRETPGSLGVRRATASVPQLNELNRATVAGYVTAVADGLLRVCPTGDPQALVVAARTAVTATAAQMDHVFDNDGYDEELLDESIRMALLYLDDVVTSAAMNESPPSFA